MACYVELNDGILSCLLFKVPVKFTFIPKFGEVSVSQSWLIVEPINGEIPPGTCLY